LDSESRPEGSPTSCQHPAKSSSGRCLFVCATVRIVLNFFNNLLWFQLFRGRDAAEWRNMGGSSRAVLVVSNPETMPPFLRSSPTALPLFQHFDAPDPDTLFPSHRPGLKPKATSQTGRPCRFLSLYDSSRSCVTGERMCRQSQLRGRELVSERNECEKGKGPDKGAVCRRGRPIASEIGFRKVRVQQEPSRRR
jgi:hypothetical protein